ncbi:MAG TPA: type II secretion system F family protein [archaeon]|nr:type II secretion system F family protein [archaeon]
MPEQLDQIKKQIEERKKQKALEEGQIRPQQEKLDEKKVDTIVARMKKKYTDQGVENSQVGGKLGELRGIITENEMAAINVENVEDLTEFRSPIIKRLGKFYIWFRPVMEILMDIMKKLPITSDTRYYLYSANMRYSITQWLALTISAAVIAMLVTLISMGSLSFYFDITQAYTAVITIIVGMFTLAIMLLIPRGAARRRGNEVSTELPFALRHMATELKAGLGLYKTIQTIAVADYGVLSQEFARTVTEIEEGTDAKDALTHFALRTQSKALRNAMLHVVRALKTGGNLSDIMNTIAEDVSFDLRVRVRDYAEKMNFFGVIYIFIAIVAPVFLAIIGAVLNAPVSIGNVSVPPILITITYMVIMPAILGFLIIYLRMSEPKV